jgi:hypothetical protein
MVHLGNQIIASLGWKQSAVQPLLDYLQLKTPNLSSFLLMEESF